jgi:hypothetical protein
MKPRNKPLKSFIILFHFFVVNANISSLGCISSQVKISQYITIHNTKIIPKGKTLEREMTSVLGHLYGFVSSVISEMESEIIYMCV